VALPLRSRATDNTELTGTSQLRITFQKSILVVALLKDEMNIKECRVSDFPFSCISTIQLWVERFE